MDRLRVFIGIWKGNGQGVYPTIQPFDYEETLTIEADADFTVLHYDQRTKVTTPNRPSHWESGFIKPLPNGLVQISNSQNGGRVEVSQGQLILDAEITRLDVASIVLDNDPRMAQTSRVFEVLGDRLTYEMSMATRTTKVSVLQGHLRACLFRA